ncbi:hypothetical protein [Agrobacterium sp. SORGH_AS 787]
MIENCELNALDSLTYVRAMLTAIVKGYKKSRVEYLLR